MNILYFIDKNSCKILQGSTIKIPKGNKKGNYSKFQSQHQIVTS